MVTRELLLELLETLSQSRADGPVSRAEFGQMLGKAGGRYLYSRSYVSKLLHGKVPITPQIEYAARILMIGMAGMGERIWSDPFPIFQGGPVSKLQQAKETGVRWQEIYVQDAQVRSFVDALIDLIIRG